MDTAAATQAYLLYFVMPLWLLTGVADWLCHRASHIETTSGWRETLLHIAMLAEIGFAVLLGLLAEINALVIAIMIAAFVAHEATALVDLHYAWKRRVVTPWEQHVHDYLAVVPLLAVSFVVVLHWPQALALAGLGPEAADFSLRWKTPPLPAAYLIALAVGVLLLEVVPYGEELLRGLRAQRESARRESAQQTGDPR